MKTKSLLLIVLLIFSFSSIAQQPLTPKQTQQANKVIKKLSHFDTGTKLDVKLTDGSHHIGILGETGSDTFILTDPVSKTSETISYLDVKHLQITRKEAFSNTLGKTGNALPKIAVGVVIFVAILAGIAITHMD